MKLLVPVDQSEASTKTLEWAAENLKRSTTEYYLLTVVAKTFPEEVIEPYQVSDAVEFLESSKKLLQDTGCNVAKCEYVVGDPISTICKYAQTHDVDQILMGSHGRSALANILIGSISSEVLKAAKVPVLIYRNVERASKPA